MLRTLAVVVTMAALVVSAGTAVSAGASVAATGNPRICAALTSEQDLLSANGPSSKEAAATSAKVFRSVAKVAPRKIKRALIVIAKSYERIADGDSVREVVTADAAKIVKAYSTFGRYYVKNCATVPSAPG